MQRSLSAIASGGLPGRILGDAMTRRVVVTGVGCVTPLGTTVNEFWHNLVEGHSGVGPITSFDASSFSIRIAAEVRNWDLSAAGEDPARWAKHARQTRFAVGAGIEAVQSAGLSAGAVDPLRFGVYMGCGETFPELADLGRSIVSSLEGRELKRHEFLRAAMGVIDPEHAVNCEPHVPAQCLAALFDAQGPNANCIAACASSTQSIGNAAEMIRRGQADMMLAGGAHSLIHPMGLTGLSRLAVLSPSVQRLAQAMRPFDAGRDGFVVGEGAAVVVLEDLEHAVRRGAEIWGELTGFCYGHDAFHLTDPDPTGRAVQRCIETALQQARLNFDQIDYINAHGTSTPLNDRTETAALKRTFGATAYRIPVSSTKSMLGHATTACGAIEFVAALMAVRTGVLPPTINYETPDPDCDLDYVPNVARETRCRHAMSDSLGFGGQTAAVIVSRFDEPCPSRGLGWAA